MNYDVLIIGAGAAGLLAAKELAANGKTVAILEAGEKAGGRIHTIADNNFDTTLETGPEFIHGNLPLTFALLKEANLSATETSGDFINVINGKWHAAEDGKDWAAFMKQLSKLDNDISLQAFLEKHFPEDKYTALHTHVKDYAEGFDLADISRASSLFVQKEWNHQEEQNYRINGGYSKLISYLEQQCLRHNVSMLFNHVVTCIDHAGDVVTVYTNSEEKFTGTKVIVTVSAGVLQSNMIEWRNLPLAYHDAIQQLGFGAVIKMLLQFKSDFWKDYADDIGFILSNEQIPTWWTQLPARSAMLTGWLGGPPAAALSTKSEDALLHIALQSLSNIFSKPVRVIQEQLVSHKIFCWHNEPYVKGGYSYVTVEAAAAKKLLNQPVDNKILFAGEAMYEGASQGTVEAALQTGMQAANMVNKQSS